MQTKQAKQLHPIYRYLGLGFGLLLMTAIWNQSNAQHEHPAADAAPSRLALDNGRKWPTDAPLRQGMTRIRDALQAKLPAIHTDKLDEAGYAALTEKVNGQIGYIVQNCKLEPKADAMLHLIIADVLAGAEVLEGKQAGTARHEGAVKILTALNNYGTYFDHPNW